MRFVQYLSLTVFLICCVCCDNIIEDFRQSKLLNNLKAARSASRSPSDDRQSESSKKATFVLKDACPTSNQDCVLAFQSIQMLHKQLDDDADGSVDFSESNDFLTEELKYDSGHVNKRQKAFHFNNDMRVSVQELWEAWIQSEVHNWTAQQTCDWLEVSVRLPQYARSFIDYKVTGALLPRLAVNNMNFLSTVLGIKDPIHKQKIVLKAMDVVLFGSPKDSQKYWKDLLLVTLLVGAITGAYYAYCQNKKSRNHLMRMMKDMESLQYAEQTLEKLQRELEEARMQKDCVTNEKETLEKKLKQASSTELSEADNNSETEVIQQLRQELEVLRNELKLAEGELKDRCWSPPFVLQHWLQFSYELENNAYLKKKMAAEIQLQSARDACEKLRKKRSTLVGSFVSTHGKNIDDVDKSIMDARNSLSEITFELQERSYRWKQIESLCGFRIINNKGLSYLDKLLYKNGSSGKIPHLLSGQQSSQDDNDDDTSSLYSLNASEKPLVSSSSLNRIKSTSPIDSSGSIENINNTTNQLSNSSSVDFILGSDLLEIKPENEVKEAKSLSNIVASLPQQRIRPIPKPKPKPPMIRSRSQDIQLPCSHVCDDWISAVDASSLLENCRFQQQFLNQKSDLVDDENNSTDSSSVSNDDLLKKKHKNKLNFGTFAKKIKSKIN